MKELQADMLLEIDPQRRDPASDFVPLADFEDLFTGKSARSRHGGSGWRTKSVLGTAAGPF